MFANSGMPGVAAYALEIAGNQANITTQKITAVAVNGGTGEITVTLGGIPQLVAPANVLAFVPVIGVAAIGPGNTSGSVQWYCSASAAVPASTTILPNYLPAECRQ